jgi:plastocyanin
MKTLKIAMALAFVAGAAVAAYAADKTINQKGKIFSESEITVKKGESVNFLNDDNIVHNVMSTSAGNEFNVGAAKPGTATPVTFKNAGDVRVICAIHPSMKLLVKVVE